MSYEGRKDDHGKARWSLIPWLSMGPVLQVLEFGAQKYGPGNWAHVEDAQDRYWDAAMRHMIAWRGGERKDPETGRSHLAHAVCCLLFMLHFEEEEQHG